MAEQIKSGQEILDEFFSQIGNIEGVDQDVAQTVLRLYQEGKLTNTNLSNDLSTIREKEEHET
ncbi:MAG: hypothetical protein DYG83_01150 [Candidatus Brocadia sp. AMX2]|uniref:Uncharacterized protein n=1 Tax=Candidatus Brocadia sinica JPN1 TaxID=1197129 RepID=A0ABQ0JVR9_9BACT|nr:MULTISPECIES: hypothetical protein [Brocadia]MBC6930755.1 hypothetical protein [Candidatus Brocadia sp.]MBL1167724.1 hypothetical protein [Candidatus Brocadia sp. AMX1]NOG41337.1 hypothetical protein [Planctomycetota bacterium]GIK13661.1 MAG: hypothetical protein BroJett002_23680 [Candidatus Brocadia sinica]KAA0245603.1 MAG: hypothetical protein EDM70_01585 [Candidatus Brocadia sp. AMX2]